MLLVNLECLFVRNIILSLTNVASQRDIHYKDVKFLISSAYFSSIVSLDLKDVFFIMRMISLISWEIFK